MRPFAFLIAFLVLAPAAHAQPPHVNGVAWIGDLELRFDANRWDVNGADTAYNVFCTASGCAHTAIAVTVVDAAETACTPDALHPDDPEGSQPQTDKFDKSGLTFLVSEIDLGCRNLAGGPVHACTTYGGKTYLFDAPGEGCHTPWHASEHVDEILQGLKPR